MIDYNPKEFTLSEYVRLLTLAKNKHPFKKFTEFDPREGFILWRHDVDFSLVHALTIAEIECQNQVQSTYFIHLHNDFYNALDIESKKIIKKIVSMGHDIGLHFDMHYYDIQSLTDLEYWLGFEKKTAESLFNVEINVFSFHNTTDYSMSFEAEQYAGMLNTYSSYFKQNVSYCSDSNGYWRFRSLASVLQDSSIQKLQVLLHPCWWTDDELMPRDKILRCAKKRYELNIAAYDQTLVQFGRINLK